MRAIVINEFGPVSSHAVEDVAEPVPARDEVLIENHAIGLNFADALMLRGKYFKWPARPFVPGRDCAGVVVATGSDVSRCEVGDRVVAQVLKGGFGELVSAPEMRCFRLPEQVSFEDAAAMITVFNTAWIAVDIRAQVQSGDTVMVTGASGGVGSASVQLLKARGATVLAAVSSSEKGAFAKENGADILIDTNAPNLDTLKTHFKNQVADATGAAEGKGCDAVIDTVGGDIFEAGLRVLRFGGKLVIVGFAGGTIPTPKANFLLYNNLAVMGAPLDIHFDKAYDIIERGVSSWLALHASGKLKSNITGRYPLDEFVTAFDQITGRNVRGKLILDPRN